MLPFDRITLFCFQASYACALGLELIQLLSPRPVQRLLSTIFGFAGLLAHTLYLVSHPLSLSSQMGSMLFLAWILAVFYLYGSLHHRRLAWGVFVLPVVLGLTVLANVHPGQSGVAQSESAGFLDALRGERFWGLIHGSLLLLAAVGVCVGFVASVMYLLQAHRLKAKAPPGDGLRLLSLERLERMNRRAIILAFPLLTAGVLVGIALMIHQRMVPFADWSDPRIVSTVVLWLVFAILLYLRYGYHLRGRRMAILTIVAFGLLLFTLASTHTSASGGRP
jgi:ABC-type transport system involved in cytochrome c biogenesis permease subunit